MTNSAIAATAFKQALSVYFLTLGRFQDNPMALLKLISDAAHAAKSKGSRYFESVIFDAFETTDGAKLNVQFVDTPVELIPPQVQALADLLQSSLTPVAETSSPITALLETTARDWELESNPGYSGPLKDSSSFKVAMLYNENVKQFYVDVTPLDDDKAADASNAQAPYLSTTVEINLGHPCLHVTNQPSGEAILSIYATEAGLVVRPSQTDLVLHSAKFGEFPKESTIYRISQEPNVLFVSAPLNALCN